MKLTIDLDVEGYREECSITEMINRCVEDEIRRHVLSELRKDLASRKEEIKKEIAQATEAELVRAMRLLRAEKDEQAKKAELAAAAAMTAIDTKEAAKAYHCEICGGKGNGCPHCRG